MSGAVCVISFHVHAVQRKLGPDLVNLLQYHSLDETGPKARTSKGMDSKKNYITFVLHLLSEVSSSFRNLEQHSEKAEHKNLQKVMAEVAQAGGGDLILHLIARCVPAEASTLPRPLYCWLPFCATVFASIELCLHEVNCWPSYRGRAPCACTLAALLVPFKWYKIVVPAVCKFCSTFLCPPMCRVILPRFLRVMDTPETSVVTLEGKFQRALDLLALDLYQELFAAWQDLKPYHRQLKPFLR